MAEDTIWKGSPAQIVNLKWNLLAVLLIILGAAGFYYLPEAGFTTTKALGFLAYLLVPALVWFIPWLQVNAEQYELTPERLKMRKGVLNRESDELELYRVRDTTVYEPFFLRIFGAGHVVVQSSDRTHPELKIRAIRQPEKLRQDIRGAVEKMRESKHVRDVDMGVAATGGEGALGGGEGG